MVDVAWVLREIAKYADDARKEAKAFMELVEKLACVRWVEENANSVEVKKIEGEYASGTPNVKQMASLPHPTRHPERYKALMDFLGIPAAVRDAGLVHADWKAFTEHLTNLAALGRPLPPGIDADKTYPVYSLELRQRKGVDVDEI